MGRGTVYHDVTFVGLIIDSCWLKFFLTMSRSFISQKKEKELEHSKPGLLVGSLM
jgi:hypothetical protein